MCKALTVNDLPYFKDRPTHNGKAQECNSGLRIK